MCNNFLKMFLRVNFDFLYLKNILKCFKKIKKYFKKFKKYLKIFKSVIILARVSYFEFLGLVIFLGLRIAILA